MMKIDDGPGEFSEFVIWFDFTAKKERKPRSDGVKWAREQIEGESRGGMNSGKRLSPNL